MWKAVGKEVVSSSITCRLLWCHTSKGCKSKEGRRFELFSCSSVCYTNLRSHSPQASTFFPHLLYFPWLPNDSLSRSFLSKREQDQALQVQSCHSNQIHFPCKWLLPSKGYSKAGVFPLGHMVKCQDWAMQSSTLL